MHQLKQQLQQQHAPQPLFSPSAVAASSQQQQQQPRHQQQSMLPFGGLCFSRSMASSSRRSRRSGGRGASRSARTAAAGSHANEPSVSTVEQQQQHQEDTPPPAPPAVAAAAADIGGGSSDMMRPVTRPLYSPLHYNILEFAAQVVPTPAERAEKQRVIQCVAVATRRAFESVQGLKVQPFGSFVNGLSVWDSDVDLVVTGLVAPSKLSGGFSSRDKQAVYRALERIASQLRRHKKVSVAKLVIIRTARIPLIKLQTASRVVADISLGDASGPKAANYIAQQVNAYPPLGPLVLVLKVYLRNCGLNEVMNGGLSSFSLTNMVLAHLMEELKDGNDIFDLGEALYGFLLRFGDEFDMRRDAVSVSLGGVVSRWELGHLAAAAGGGGGALAQERLLLEDPLTGRDVASGSYRFQAVQTAFARAARRLEALAQSRGSSGSGGSGGSSGPINYLEGLFDVRRALDRQAGLAGLGAAPLQRRRGQPIGGNDDDGFSNGRRAHRDDSYHIIGRSSRYLDTAAAAAAAAGEGLDDLELTLAGPPGSSSSSRGGSWDEAADGFDDELEALLYPGEPPSRRSRRRRGAGE